MGRYVSQPGGGGAPMILSSLWGHCEGYRRGPALEMEARSGAAGCKPCGSLLSSSPVLSSYVPPAWLPSSPLLFSQTKDDYGETACTQQASSANQQIPKASTTAAAATATAAPASTAASAAPWLGPTGPGWSSVHTYHWHRASSAMPPGDSSTPDLGETGVLQHGHFFPLSGLSLLSLLPHTTLSPCFISNHCSHSLCAGHWAKYWDTKVSEALAQP